MKTVEIEVSKYTRFPGGRYSDDGEGNGTDFRELHLVNVLKSGDRAKIFLGGVAGYPSSFLEEVFGGLVRVNGLSASQVLDSIEFDVGETSFKMVPAMVEKYVKNAEEAKNKALKK